MMETELFPDLTIDLVWTYWQPPAPVGNMRPGFKVGIHNFSCTQMGDNDDHFRLSSVSNRVVDNVINRESNMQLLKSHILEGWQYWSMFSLKIGCDLRNLNLITIKCLMAASGSSPKSSSVRCVSEPNCGFLACPSPSLYSLQEKSIATTFLACNCTTHSSYINQKTIEAVAWFVIVRYLESGLIYLQIALHRVLIRWQRKYLFGELGTFGS